MILNHCVNVVNTLSDSPENRSFLGFREQSSEDFPEEAEACALLKQPASATDSPIKCEILPGITLYAATAEILAEQDKGYSPLIRAVFNAIEAAKAPIHNLQHVSVSADRQKIYRTPFSPEIGISCPDVYASAIITALGSVAREKGVNNQATIGR